MKTVFLAVFVLVQTLLTQPVTDVPKYERVRQFDVKHYVVKVSFDEKAKKVFGDSTIILTPLKGAIDSVELDAVKIAFESVVDEKTKNAFDYKYDGRKLNIDLGKSYKPGEEIRIRTKYSATPKKGIYFVGASKKSEEVKHSSQIWTQGESQETSHWLPSFDHPSDRVTTETWITTEKTNTVISNGKLISNEVKGNKRTVHHRMNQDHPLYLLSFVVGEFARVDEKHGDLPMSNYLYPGLEKRSGEIFGRTKKMMEFFEEISGIPYPFDKYDQVMVSDFPFGGMENITATTYSDTELLYGPRDAADDLIAHELAHAWFGNMVTCKNWAELWTNEAFASFMEAAFRERINGKGDYLRKIRSDANRYFGYNATSRNARHGLYNVTADPITETTMFDPVTYNKGSAVIHTLRREIGEDAFWKGIRIYLKENKFGLVGKDQVKAAFEKSSKRNLDWFFKQWVEGVGHPKLTVAPVFENATGKLTLKISQKASDGSSRLYKLPVTLRVKTSQGEFTEKIQLEKKSHRLTLETKLAPETIVIDPDMNLPLLEVQQRETKTN